MGSADQMQPPVTKYDHATRDRCVALSIGYQQQDSVGLAMFDQTLSRYFKRALAGTVEIVINELHRSRAEQDEHGKILDQIARSEPPQHDRDPADFLTTCGIQQAAALRYKKHEYGFQTSTE